MMKITYIGHSGFLAETEDACFLFDYYKGGFPQMDTGKKMFVFVSHSHRDHFNREIFKLGETFRQIRYILSSDLPPSDIPVDEEAVVTVGPDEEKEILGCSVKTLRSNDMGVAFLVRYGGKTLYHAGDLNWWHWEGEPEAYNDGMKRSYQSEIDRLSGESIDAAFVPVDPRLGEAYCLGIDYFMRHTDTAHVFPMHFWNDYNVCHRLSREKRAQKYRERIVMIERAGETFIL